jgi:hypothetical protein
VLAVLTDGSTALPTGFARLFGGELVGGSLLVSGAAPHPGDFSSSLFVHPRESSTFDFLLRQRFLLSLPSVPV